jgi:hypothetical protein
VLENRTKLDFLVFITVLSLPFGGFSIETGVVNISAPNLLIIVTLFSVAFKNRGEVNTNKRQSIVILLGVFFIFYTYLSTVYYAGSLRSLITYSGFLFLMISIIIYCRGSEQVRLVFHAMFLSAIVISILTIVHVLLYPSGLPFGDIYRGQRTVGGIKIPVQRSIGVPMSYGSFGMYSLAATPYYAYVAVRRKSTPLLLGVVTIITAVLISQSRSAWLAAMVAMIILLFGHYLEKYRDNQMLLGTVGLGTIAFIIPGVVSALIHIQPGTARARFEQYQYAIDVLLSSPITGVGLGNLNSITKLSYKIHSAFLNIGAASGLPALLPILIIWAGAVVYLLKLLFHSSTNFALTLGLLAGIAVVTIESNLQPAFSKAPWVIIALIVSLECDSPRENFS